jgi:hypothetical protein
MSLGPILGRPFLQAVETRNLFAQFAVHLFQGGHFAKQLDQQSLKLWTAQTGK